MALNPLEQQQFGTADVEWVKVVLSVCDRAVVRSRPNKPFFVSTRTSCSELRTSCSGRKDKGVMWSVRIMNCMNAAKPRLRVV